MGGWLALPVPLGTSLSKSAWLTGCPFLCLLTGWWWPVAGNILCQLVNLHLQVHQLAGRHEVLGGDVLEVSSFLLLLATFSSCWLAGWLEKATAKEASQPAFSCCWQHSLPVGEPAYAGSPFGWLVVGG